MPNSNASVSWVALQRLADVAVSARDVASCVFEEHGDVGKVKMEPVIALRVALKEWDAFKVQEQIEV